MSEWTPFELGPAWVSLSVGPFVAAVLWRASLALVGQVDVCGRVLTCGNV
jgi:hypothetical protein